MTTNASSDTNPREIIVELYNEAQHDRDAPFAILASVLEDMQQAFHLLALQYVRHKTEESTLAGSDCESHSSPIPNAQLHRQVNAFTYPPHMLRFRQPLEIAPILENSPPAFSFDHEEPGIDIYASTLEEMEISLVKEIGLLWPNYALADEKTLTEEARQLKKRLLAAIEELPQ